MYSDLEATIEFLDSLANKLDAWALQSRSGGWSTHHVADNREAANDCRREAAKLRLAIKEAKERAALPG